MRWCPFCPIRAEESEKEEVEEDVGKDYVLRRRIGVGESGTIYLGTNLKDDSSVAVKKITKKNFGRTDSEADLLAKMNHENVVKFYAKWSTDYHVFIAMEYVNGGDLFDYVFARGYLCERDVKLVAAEILKGLVYMHSMNILHRDLKLENVLIDVFPKAKLADFGLAKQTDSEIRKRQSRSCGSFEYMAPEVFNVEPYGFEADMWSFGVIVYASLCGCLPFSTTANLIEYRASVLRLEFGWDRTKCVPSEASRDFISSFIRLNPDERPSAEKALECEYIQKSASKSKA